MKHDDAVRLWREDAEAASWRSDLYSESPLMVKIRSVVLHKRKTAPGWIWVLWRTDHPGADLERGLVDAGILADIPILEAAKIAGEHLFRMEDTNADQGTDVSVADAQDGGRQTQVRDPD